MTPDIAESIRDSSFLLIFMLLTLNFAKSDFVLSQTLLSVHRWHIYQRSALCLSVNLHSVFLLHFRQKLSGFKKRQLKRSCLLLLLCSSYVSTNSVNSPVLHFGLSDLSEGTPETKENIYNSWMLNNQYWQIRNNAKKKSVFVLFICRVMLHQLALMIFQGKSLKQVVFINPWKTTI